VLIDLGKKAEGLRCAKAAPSQRVELLKGTRLVGLKRTLPPLRFDALDSRRGFQDFLGNPATVTRLRESIAVERFPHSLILAGPKGAGKYTLALMLARAVNCLHPTQSDGLPDFCGECRNCARIGDAANLEERVRRPLRRGRTCAMWTSARRAS